MALSFRGGIHPEEAKRSAACPLEEMTAGDFVTIPLQQHIGVCASALVKAGDFVKKGQKIADGDGLCCPIHASVSGRVSSIGKVVTPAGDGLGIVIENDYREELCSTVQPFPKSLAEATTEELIGWIREKGIVGFGGATFPTWVKVQGAVGKVRRVVINCAECEPYLTSNHRLLVERAREVILGVRILNRIIGCDRAVFAIEDNKPDAAKELVSLLRGQKEISVSVFKTKYPQGDERQLVRALLKKEIPRGKLPADLGIVIFNAETCWAVYRAFTEGIPAITRVVTVSGDCVHSPANLLVPIGVSFGEVFQRCGGFVRPPDKIVSGGPMMGQAQWSTSAPITKGVGGILALSSPIYQAGNCIHCGRCVRACPMHLMPLELYRSISTGNLSEAEHYHVTVCNECGCCTWVCPARIPILQNIRIGKDMLRAKQQKR